MPDYDEDLTYIRLVGLYSGVVADTVGTHGDEDTTPNRYSPWMDAMIEVHVAGARDTVELRLVDADPPRTVMLLPIDARVEGGIFRLPGQSSGVNGVEIIAKSALMGLGDVPLLCTVTFGPAKIGGRSYQYEPVTFMLPTVEPEDYDPDDLIELNLTTVDRVDAPPSTPNELVVRLIPDEVRQTGSTIRFYSGGAALDGTVTLPQGASGASGATGATGASGVPGEVTLTGTQTLTNKTLTDPKVVGIIKDTNGAAILGTNPIASAVNYLFVQNAVTTDFPKLRTTGSDTDVSLGFRTKGAGSFRFQDAGGAETFQVVPVASAVNFLRVDSSAAGAALPVWAIGSDTDISINLRPKGSGTVQASGVPVVTTTGAQAITNKTISGASNTITNLPASATPDAARLVVTTVAGGATTEDGANTWAKVASFNLSIVARSANVLLSFSNERNNIGSADTVLCAVYVESNFNTPGYANISKVEIIGAAGSVFTPDGFKLISGGYGTPYELWVRKSSSYCTVRVFELSRSVSSTGVTITYNDGATWQASTPTGAVTNVTSNGVTAFSVPVVTTTGTQTLTGKTLTSPRVNQINDTNGNAHIILGAAASAVNRLSIYNAAAGGPPAVSADGSDTDIGLSLRPKGAGQIEILSANPTIAAKAAGADANLNLIPKGSGTVQANGNPVVTTVSVPAAATSTGKPGQIAYDSSYLYVCTATNTWRRAALSTW